MKPLWFQTYPVLLAGTL